MSRKYQGLIILKTKSLEGSIDDLVTSVSKEIQAEGAKLDKIVNLGRREFAYESNHLQSGHYINYYFEGSNDLLNKVQARLRLNTNVHLQHYQRIA
jgi:small subunit ribosomal protein S6